MIPVHGGVVRKSSPSTAWNAVVGNTNAVCITVVLPKFSSSSFVPSVNSVSPDATCTGTEWVRFILLESTSCAETTDILAPLSTIVSTDLPFTFAFRDSASVVRRLTFLFLSSGS